MPSDEKSELVLAVLREFDRLGLLGDLILVGSWCHMFYREYFGDPLSIPPIRTADVDFLVPHPMKQRAPKDVSGALAVMGFQRERSRLFGSEKFVHPNLEIEFLASMRGSGEIDHYDIKGLGIRASSIRFLEFLQTNLVRVSCEGVTVQLPEPAAYVLHKFLINPRRSAKKQPKDLETVKQLSYYMVARGKELERLKALFAEMPAKWKKTILDLAKREAGWLHDLLVP